MREGRRNKTNVNVVAAVYKIYYFNYSDNVFQSSYYQGLCSYAVSGMPLTAQIMSPLRINLINGSMGHASLLQQVDIHSG